VITYSPGKPPQIALQCTIRDESMSTRMSIAIKAHPADYCLKTMHLHSIGCTIDYEYKFLG
jgi:hypothetical protein